jgi:iron complex outermembrane recepter protein
MLSDHLYTVSICICRSSAIALALTGVSHLAFAQQPAAPHGDNDSGLEEIVVVAQKREQKLVDVPIAISAFSSKKLDDAGIRTAEDLASFVPNLTLIPEASGNTTYAVSMRGVAQTDSVITADSPVAVYIDGVVVPKLSGGIFDFIDLEQAEVLRGPQGTLYGRNTPAGAINLITRKPSGEFGLDASVGYGNYNEREIRAAVDTPRLELGDLGTFSVRVTGRYYARDGWVKDLRVLLNNGFNERSV